MKISLKEVHVVLDQLYFLPLNKNETIEIRAASIEAYLKSVDCTLDDLLNENLEN